MPSRILIVLLTLFIGYSVQLYTTKSGKEKALTAEALHGKQVWQQQNCIACHQVYGLGGYLGPDLTNIYHLRPEAYLRGIIQSGTASMPSFGLNPNDLDALIMYLKELDASGMADPTLLKPNRYGQIEPIHP